MEFSNWKAIHDNIGDDLQASFCKACKKGNEDVVALLLKDSRIDLTNSRKGCNVVDAIWKGHAGVVALFLTDPRMNAKELLYMVALLLTHPKVNTRDVKNRAIREAVEEGYADVISVLLNSPEIDPSVVADYAVCSTPRGGRRCDCLINGVRDPVLENSGLVMCSPLSQQSFEEILSLFNVEASLKKKKKLRA